MKSMRKIVGLIFVSLISLSSVVAQGKPDARKEWLNGRYARAIEICEDELKAIYGDRILDRLHEMCNTIFYDGEQQSYRM